MTLERDRVGFTMPVAIVAATLRETNAPAKFSTAAKITATRGESARVETLVAIEFAVSWKPFVKSKKSATATTATSVPSRALQLRVLDDDVADHVRRRLAGVDRILERLEDVLPADDDERVDPRVAGRAWRSRRGRSGRPRPRAPSARRASASTRAAAQPCERRWRAARPRPRESGTARAPAASADSTPYSPSRSDASSMWSTTSSIAVASS